MCRCLRIQASGFYAWLRAPLSQRAREDARQTELLRKAWTDSGKIYGYRKLHDDLLHQGETSCPKRVARLSRLAGIKAQIGYKRRPGNQPQAKVPIHSEQGSQFTSMDWAAFLKHHNFEHAMSRGGNCHDNAVAESFFNLFKRERIRRKTDRNREEARQDVFEYIEMFYNPKRKHVRNGMLSPVEFERQQKI